MFFLLQLKGSKLNIISKDVVDINENSYNFIAQNISKHIQLNWRVTTGILFLQSTIVIILQALYLDMFSIFLKLGLKKDIKYNYKGIIFTLLLLTFNICITFIGFPQGGMLNAFMNIIFGFIVTLLSIVDLLNNLHNSDTTNLISRIVIFTFLSVLLVFSTVAFPLIFQDNQVYTKRGIFLLFSVIGFIVIIIGLHKPKDKKLFFFLRKSYKL